jgi:predicted DNA-binding transcriptional regulator YafY
VSFAELLHELEVSRATLKRDLAWCHLRQDIRSFAVGHRTLLTASY